MSERAKEIVNALIEMIVDTRDNAALYEYMAAALKEAERERDERGKWSAHWHGEYVLAQAQITRVREALRLLVQNVQDYEAWQRPCHALDVAKAALAEPATAKEMFVCEKCGYTGKTSQHTPCNYLAWRAGEPAAGAPQAADCICFAQGRDRHGPNCPK